MKSPLLVVAAAAAVLLSTPVTAATGIQKFLETWKKGPLAHYPTDFTRGILPIPVHSHNDYWRDVPLISAIAVGAISVEADVWLYNSTLFVGHRPSSLNGNRTFASLYIDPLVALLEKQNPSSPFVKATHRNGVFDASAGQTLYLWVDVKTGANETWAAVKTALEPLREKGYLTTFSGGVVQRGAVTVIGTGNTPLDRVIGETERDYFVDGPLLALEERRISKEMSPIASCDLPAVVGQVGPNGLSAAQMRSVRKVVKSANERGIKTRLWDLPGWPIGKRNKVWQQMVDAGVYLLNVDDLEAAKSMGGTA